MTQFTIPETIEAATTALNGIDRLLTAKDWERAAIVYAFTCEPGSGDNRRERSSKVNFSAEEFAALGITGLTSKVTVYQHRRNWQYAIDEGWVDGVAPGATVDMSGLAGRRYPPTHPEIDEQPIETGRLVDRLRKDAPPEAKAAAIMEVMAGDPEAKKRVQDTFVQEAGKDPALAGRVYRSYKEHHVTPEKKVEPLPLWAEMGFGASLYSRVQDYSKHLDGYLLSLAANQGNPELPSIVGEEIDNLEKAEGLLRQYADKLRSAIGIEADAVFNRLVGGR